MKKISAILMALALIVMACVPFSASADEAFAYDITVSDVFEGAETIDVVITLKDLEKQYPLNGGFIVTYDAEAMEVVIPEGNRGPDKNLLTTLPNCAVNVVEEAVDPDDANSPKVPTGEIKIGFMSELAETETVVFKATFKLAAAAEVGTEYAFAIESNQLVLYDGTASGDDIIAGGVVLADEVTVVAEAIPTTTTAAPTTKATTTAAPTTTAAATTKAPVAGGEATPWALMATVAVAGAALVVLSTKKSK